MEELSSPSPRVAQLDYTKQIPSVQLNTGKMTPPSECDRKPRDVPVLILGPVAFLAIGPDSFRDPSTRGPSGETSYVSRLSTFHAWLLLKNNCTTVLCPSE